MSKLKIGTNVGMVVCSAFFLFAQGVYWYTCGRSDEYDDWRDIISKVYEEEKSSDK